MALGQQLYQLGKRGADVIQTGESFEFLTRQIGASTDLLEQLRKASRGTIDDMTLMSASLKLLGGASDELAPKLAEALPRLLEIAKAANKLNPSLGDTAFLFDSIATGIKRASPLILDNLGLTIKLGEANEKYAKQLGKSVEQLTAEEQKIALLNATLEAGNQLIKQAGGQADAAADSYARLSASWKNYVDAFSKDTTVIDGVANALANMLDRATEFHKALNLLSRASREGLIDMEEYLALRSDVNKDAAKVIAYLTVMLDDFGAKHEFLARVAANSAQEVSKAYSDMGRSEAEFARQMMDDTVLRASEAIRSKIAEMNAEMRKIVGTADGARTGIARLFDLIDRRIDSPIADFIKDLQFLQAGGGMFMQDFMMIKKALEEGKITPAQAEQFASELFAQVQELQVRLGEISAQDAAENISDTLGISLEEARAKLEEIATTKIDISGQLAIAVRFVGSPAAVAAAEAGLWSDGVNIKVGGGGGGTFAPPPGAGGHQFKQTGGPVAPGIPYVVGERGPEVFVPATSGRIIPNDRLGGNLTIINHNYNALAAATVLQQVIRLRFRRLNRGM